LHCRDTFYSKSTTNNIVQVHKIESPKQIRNNLTTSRATSCATSQNVEQIVVLQFNESTTTIVVGCLHDRANIEQLAGRSMVISMPIRRAGEL